MKESETSTLIVFRKRTDQSIANVGLVTLLRLWQPDSVAITNALDVFLYSITALFLNRQSISESTAHYRDVLRK